MEKLNFIVATKEIVDELFEFEKVCFENKPDQFSKRSLRHLIVSPTSRTIIIRNEKGKICAAAIGLLRHFKIPSGRIYKIGVLTEFARRGVGTALIEEIEKWFKNSGMKKTCAEVRESNTPSRRMFEKKGYVETKTLYYFYAGGENAAKYWKDL
ncbi:MAG: GNAT family N-acetyltransferase [Candidatus Riflebacteria bacterium]|nr:GNAT family N-acetyltransferase [Candidatus Riflebacteria bacterium]